MLSHAAAKLFYDRFGARQDSQAFYENAALDELIAHSSFETASQVFEFGCGTGRFAAELLNAHLPTSAHYLGVDVSTTMVTLATQRLGEYASRATVRCSDGSPECAVGDRSVDRVVSTYALDLLPDSEIISLIRDSARALAPHGRLCLVSLTYGERPVSRLVTAGWRFLFWLSPRLVGGCRPIRLVDYVATPTFRILHRRVLSSYAISSEVLVAERVAA